MACFHFTLCEADFSHISFFLALSSKTVCSALPLSEGPGKGSSASCTAFSCGVLPLRDSGTNTCISQEAQVQKRAFHKGSGYKHTHVSRETQYKLGCFTRDSGTKRSFHKRLRYQNVLFTRGTRESEDPLSPIIASSDCFLWSAFRDSGIQSFYIHTTSCLLCKNHKASLFAVGT